MYKLFGLLIAYILIASVFVSYFVGEAENENVDSLIETGYSAAYVDFSGETDFYGILDTSVTGSNYANIVNDTLIINPPAVGNTAIYFKGMQPKDGIYTIDYDITNTPNADFSVIISSDHKSFTPKALLMNYAGGQINVIYSDFSTIARFTANKLLDEKVDLSGNHKIKTILNTNNNKLEIYIDDVLTGYTYITDYTDEDKTCHAGIIATDTLIINSINANIYYTNENISDTNILSTLALILAWNVDEEYFPSILNFIFIKIPIILLGVGGALYIRGSS